MKLNKLFLMGAMGLGLFACSDDLVENGQNGDALNGEKTYVAISLDFGQAGSRAVVDGDYNDTDLDNIVAAAESKVTSLRIIVASSTTVEVNKLYNIENEKLPTEPYVLEMTSGQKDFYAIVNEDAALTAAAGSDKLPTSTELETYLDKIVNKTAVAITTGAANGFLMTGKTSEFINPEVEAGKAPAENPVKLVVDRVAAKVTVTTTSLNTDLAENISKVGAIKFAVVNADLTATKYTGLDLTKIAGFYRIAQAGNATPYSSFVPTDGDGKTYEHTGPSTYTPIAISATNSNAQSLYCLENTHTDGNYKQGNTTYAAFQVPIYLKTAVEFDYTAANAEQEPAVEEAAKVSNKEATVTYTPDEDAKAFYYIYAPEDLRDRYILSSHILALAAANEMNITSGTEAEKKAAVITKLKALMPGLSISDEYRDGCGYYKAWLNPDAAVKNSPVLRNNWYEMNITKLTLPGTPGGPDIDPTDPLTPPTNAAVAVTLRNWNYVKTDVDLQN